MVFPLLTRRGSGSFSLTTRFPRPAFAARLPLSPRWILSPPGGEFVFPPLPIRSLYRRHSFSLSPSLCISPTRSRGLSHRAPRIGTFSPSSGFFDPPSRSTRFLSRVDYLSPSLPFSPSFDPHCRTRGGRAVSLGPMSSGILFSFPPWSKLFLAAVAVVGQRGDRLGGGRLAGEDHGFYVFTPALFTIQGCSQYHRGIVDLSSITNTFHIVILFLSMNYI